MLTEGVVDGVGVDVTTGGALNSLLIVFLDDEGDSAAAKLIFSAVVMVVNGGIEADEVQEISCGVAEMIGVGVEATMEGAFG